MKYSILSEPSQTETPLQLTGHWSRVFSDYKTTYAVSVTQGKSLTLQYRSREVSNEEE